VDGGGAMSVPAERLAAGPTNEPVELARYRISSGERILRGQRILGVVRVSDIPAEGNGRRYLVERGLESMAELQALVDDYLAQAAIWDGIPALICWMATAEDDR
jgi:hypothetical protein